MGIKCLTGFIFIDLFYFGYRPVIVEMSEFVFINSSFKGLTRKLGCISKILKVHKKFLVRIE